MSDHKLTEAEIMKSLEICTTKGASCKDCPAFVKVDRSNCKEVLKGAIDLINRKNTENERLTVTMNAFGLGMKRESERADSARAEAIKEVLTKVKGSSNKMNLICTGALVRREYTITEESLYLIAKEMGVEL